MTIQIAELPNGANPGYKKVDTINPADKYSRSVGLNWSERSNFNGVCSLSCEQIIRCYCWLNEDVIREEFVQRCRECPYAVNENALGHNYSSRFSTRRPWFVENIVDVEWDKPKCYVYFISDGQFIKIGVANNPENRLHELQTGNPRKLFIFCQIPVKSEKEAYQLERQLHNIYGDFAKVGEWYDILDYIKQEEWLSFFGETRG